MKDQVLEVVSRPTAPCVDSGGKLVSGEERLHFRCPFPAPLTLTTSLEHARRGKNLYPRIHYVTLPTRSPRPFSISFQPVSRPLFSMLACVKRRRCLGVALRDTTPLNLARRTHF